MNLHAFCHQIEAWCFGYLRRTGLLLMCSDAPDMTAANTAAAASAATGEKALAWYQKVYDDEAPTRAAAAERANLVSDSQINLMDTAAEQSKDYGDYAKRVFRPLEEGIVKDATNFNTEGERERRAGLAGADVARAFGAARSQGVRDLGRMGINTSDGRMLGTLRELAASEALGTGFAKNKSRADSETLGRALKMDAAGLGRNLATNQTAAATTAINAGNSSAATGAMPVSQAQQAAQMVGAGYDSAIRGYGTAGNIYGGINNVQAGVNSSNSQTAGSAGAAVGTIAVMI